MHFFDEYNFWLRVNWARQFLSVIYQFEMQNFEKRVCPPELRPATDNRWSPNNRKKCNIATSGKTVATVAITLTDTSTTNKLITFYSYQTYDVIGYCEWSVITVLNSLRIVGWIFSWSLTRLFKTNDNLCRDGQIMYILPLTGKWSSQNESKTSLPFRYNRLVACK